MSVWRKALDGDDAELDLARLGFLIAAGEYEDLDLDASVDQLDELAGRVPMSAISVQSLSALLFDESGFTGNSDDYYDPRNSYLSDVLQRRQGIPITLSVVFMEVGWRLGLELAPVSFPGHFVVRVGGDDSDEFIDAFHAGQSLSKHDLLTRFRRAFGNQLPHDFDSEQLFALCSRREVVARMLRNLKQIYFHKRDWERALRVTDQLLHVDPDVTTEWRDRGHLYAQIGYMEAAMRDYSEYLQRTPNAADATQIRHLLLHSATHAKPVN